MARDYPLQGVWQVLPGPGIARIYHVKRAECLLNYAVVQAPKDPVVRLLRAVTVSQMPKFFVNHGVVMQDLLILAKWEADPSLNPDYISVLTSNCWRREVFDAYALAMSAQGDAQPPSMVHVVPTFDSSTAILR